MLIGYARVSKADGSQSLDLQRAALQAAGVDAIHVYHDYASGVRDDRPGLDSCVRALRTGDVLVIWKLDRLGRTLVHLVNTVQDLSARRLPHSVNVPKRTFTPFGLLRLQNPAATPSERCDVERAAVRTGKNS